MDDPLLPLARDTAHAFAVRFGRPPAGVAVAPGRVNLIGDHTDYNEGFVLPMALGLGTAFAFAPRDDGRLRIHFAAGDETTEAGLVELAAPARPGSFSYVAGVAWALREKGHAVRGLDALVAGSLPIGAGLSSSASLELAAARALCSTSGIRWDPVAMARLSQHAENDYVGLSCGIMDQYAAAATLEGSALLLDCRSLEARPVPVPDHAMVVVMDTGSRRGLAFSTYNERRASCETAVRALAALKPGLRALRDVDEELLEAGRGLLDALTHARAAHVVAESQRPRAMAKAFEIGDLETAGRLMDDSHASLRDLYEVSSPELDVMTELARAHPACHGARLTGAGFGGCAVALVRTR
ncbi:MAG TPA: galactokinase, partial [Vicinamibacteria bacterium]|nr:galactokinase [Vicinamibacteria bacterium]